MNEARQVCREISKRFRTPIVVGGTGLYYRAFVEGIFQGPGKSEKLRRRLDQVIQRKGLGFLYEKLRKRDPETADKLEPTDRVRIIRAIEVLILTGSPISLVQKKTKPLTGFRLRRFGLNPPRELLYGRINRRVEEMFAEGLLEEVSSVIRSGYPRNSKGFEALGYRYAFDVLEKKMILSDAIELTKRDTRRYAKRQMTWFRKEKDIFWIDQTGELATTLETVLTELGKDNDN
jgi:tRNA dimethylallyltransferase